MGPIPGHGVDRADAAEEPERDTVPLIRQCYGALQLQSVFTDGAGGAAWATSRATEPAELK